MKYGFIGCGNMGGAVARAVCKGAGSGDVLLANRTPAKHRRWRTSSAAPAARMRRSPASATSSFWV